MIISGLTIVSPWYLPLFLIVPWFWWLGHRSLAGLGRTRAILAAGLRTMIVICKIRHPTFPGEVGRSGERLWPSSL